MDVNIKSRSKGQAMGAVSAYRAGEKIYSERDDTAYEQADIFSASAYRSGENLQNKQSGKTHDYTRRADVFHSEIILPVNAPLEFQDRSALCNAIDKAEKRKDAQLVREVVVALPVELGAEDNTEMTRDFIQRIFVDEGMIADFSYHLGHIHDRQDETYPFKDLTIRRENPHVHILLTMRDVDENGFGKKNREWNKPEYLAKWREEWANTVNRKLEQKGLDIRISHLSLKEQGIDREPTKKMGHKAWKLEVKGIKTKIGEENRAIMTRNKAKLPENAAKNMHELKESYITLDRETAELRIETDQAERESRVLKHKAEKIFEDVAQIRDQRGRDYFKQKYNFAPEQAKQEVQRLEDKARSLGNLHTKLREKLTPFVEEKRGLLLEYQRQKLLADISADKAKIEANLARLEKETRGKLSPKENIARLNIVRVLNDVKEPNFSEVLKQVKPEQARELVRRRERERERTRGRFR